MAKFIKDLLKQYGIQNRLFINSVFLTTIVILSLFFLSQSFVSNLIIKNQTDYELNSFKQVGNFYKSLFDNIEGRIRRIHSNQKLVGSISDPYNTNDLSTYYDTGRLIDRELSNIFSSESYVEKVIFLGRNGCAYVYTPGYSGAFLSYEWDFMDFYSRSYLSPYFQNSEPPFYYLRTGSQRSLNETEEALYTLLNNRIIFIRTLRDEWNYISGTVIITFRNSSVTNVLANSEANQYLYLMDLQQSLIWSNNYDGKSAPDLSSLNGSNGPGYFIKTIQSKNYLITYNILSPFKLRLISQIPLKDVLEQMEKIKIYTLLYGLICFLFVLVTSYFFSGMITKPLHILTNNLVRDISTVSVQPRIDFDSSRNRFSLRYKIIIYFITTIIIPNIIYITLSSYLIYEGYNKKLAEYTIYTISQVKLNIDYKLQNFSEITEQLIFCDEIQDLLTRDKKYNLTQQNIDSIEKLIFNTKSSEKEFVSMNLYNTQGESLFSSTRYDNSPISSSMSAVFLDRLDHSNDRLIFLGAQKDLSMNSNLYFARKVRNMSSTNFGKPIGYFTCALDQDYLNRIIQKIKFEDSGYFFLMDSDGNILTHDNEEFTASLIQANPGLTSLNGGSKSVQVQYKSQNYLIIYDSSSISNMQIFGVVPLQEISSKVSPIVWFSTIFLIAYSLIIVVISSLISRRIVRPLKQLQSLMGEVEKGNFNVHMGYSGVDEIAILTEKFNHMVEKLQVLITENYESAIREKELMFLEKEAQLNALQQQINPHFLYNTLESIKWIAYKNGINEICDMTSALGKFFRGSITKGKGIVTFEEEIEHLKNYLYIQQIRYQDKFQVKWEIDENVLPCKTVKLILQPLVENTINHGLESIEKGGLIVIRGYISGESVCFEIYDNGVGMSVDHLDELKASLNSPITKDSRPSIGLSNVYRRLHLFLGDQCVFNIVSFEGKGTTIKIQIPKMI